MLYYDINDISEGIEVNKTSASKECDICHYWYFLDKEFKFEPYVCNGCYDVLMMYKNLDDKAIWKLYDIDYRCVVTSITKREAIKLQNINLKEKTRTLKHTILSSIKKDKEVLTFGHIEIEKHNSYLYKNPVFKKDVEIEHIFVLNKTFSCENNYKYFINYLQDD